MTPPTLTAIAGLEPVQRRERRPWADGLRRAAADLWRRTGHALRRQVTRLQLGPAEAQPWG